MNNVFSRKSFLFDAVVTSSKWAENPQGVKHE